MNPTNISELDESTRHRLLADEQRRLLVESLKTARGGVETTLDELADYLQRAAQRTGRVEADRRRTLRCRLHHVHLPMLDDADLLDYDPETKRVRLDTQWAVTASAESD